jgi:hypothetical protein
MGFRSETAHEEGFLGIFVPKGMAAGTENIAIVFEKFFEAGPGDVRELELGLLGSAARLAGFDDVCLPERAA